MNRANKLRILEDCFEATLNLRELRDRYGIITGQDLYSIEEVYKCLLKKWKIKNKEIVEYYDSKYKKNDE